MTAKPIANYPSLRVLMSSGVAALPLTKAEDAAARRLFEDVGETFRTVEAIGAALSQLGIPGTTDTLIDDCAALDPPFEPEPDPRHDKITAEFMSQQMEGKRDADDAFDASCQKRSTDQDRSSPKNQNRPFDWRSGTGVRTLNGAGGAVPARGIFDDDGLPLRPSGADAFIGSSPGRKQRASSPLRHATTQQRAGDGKPTRRSVSPGGGNAGGNGGNNARGSSSRSRAVTIAGSVTTADDTDAVVSTRVCRGERAADGFIEHELQHGFRAFANDTAGSPDTEGAPPFSSVLSAASPVLSSNTAKPLGATLENPAALSANPLKRLRAASSALGKLPAGGDELEKLRLAQLSVAVPNLRKIAAAAVANAHANASTTPARDSSSQNANHGAVQTAGANEATSSRLKGVSMTGKESPRTATAAAAAAAAVADAAPTAAAAVQSAVRKVTILSPRETPAGESIQTTEHPPGSPPLRSPRLVPATPMSPRTAAATFANAAAATSSSLTKQQSSSGVTGAGAGAATATTAATAGAAGAKQSAVDPITAWAHSVVPPEDKPVAESEPALPGHFQPPSDVLPLDGFLEILRRRKFRHFAEAAKFSFDSAAQGVWQEFGDFVSPEVITKVMETYGLDTSVSEEAKHALAFEITRATSTSDVVARRRRRLLRRRFSSVVLDGSAPDADAWLSLHRGAQHTIIRKKKSHRTDDNDPTDDTKKAAQGLGQSGENTSRSQSRSRASSFGGTSQQNPGSHGFDLDSPSRKRAPKISSRLLQTTGLVRNRPGMSSKHSGSDSERSGGGGGAGGGGGGGQGTPKASGGSDSRRRRSSFDPPSSSDEDDYELVFTDNEFERLFVAGSGLLGGDASDDDEDDDVMFDSGAFNAEPTLSPDELGGSGLGGLGGSPATPSAFAPHDRTLVARGSKNTSSGTNADGHRKMTWKMKQRMLKRYHTAKLLEECEHESDRTIDDLANDSDMIPFAPELEATINASGGGAGGSGGAGGGGGGSHGKGISSFATVAGAAAAMAAANAFSASINPTGGGGGGGGGVPLPAALSSYRRTSTDQLPGLDRVVTPRGGSGPGTPRITLTTSPMNAQHTGSTQQQLATSGRSGGRSGAGGVGGSGGAVAAAGNPNVRFAVTPPSDQREQRTPRAARRSPLSPSATAAMASANQNASGEPSVAALSDSQTETRSVGSAYSYFTAKTGVFSAGSSGGSASKRRGRARRRVVTPLEKITHAHQKRVLRAAVHAFGGESEVFGEDGAMTPRSRSRVDQLSPQQRRPRSGLNVKFARAEFRTSASDARRRAENFIASTAGRGDVMTNGLLAANDSPRRARTRRSHMNDQTSKLNGSPSTSAAPLSDAADGQQAHHPSIGDISSIHNPTGNEDDDDGQDEKDDTIVARDGHGVDVVMTAAEAVSHTLSVLGGSHVSTTPYVVKRDTDPDILNPKRRPLYTPPLLQLGARALGKKQAAGASLAKGQTQPPGAGGKRERKTGGPTPDTTNPNTASTETASSRPQHVHPTAIPMRGHLESASEVAWKGSSGSGGGGLGLTDTPTSSTHSMTPLLSTASQPPPVEPAAIGGGDGGRAATPGHLSPPHASLEPTPRCDDELVAAATGGDSHASGGNDGDEKTSENKHTPKSEKSETNGGKGSDDESYGDDYDDYGDEFEDSKDLKSSHKSTPDKHADQDDGKSEKSGRKSGAESEQLERESSADILSARTPHSMSKPPRPAGPGASPRTPQFGTPPTSFFEAPRGEGSASSDLLISPTAGMRRGTDVRIPGLPLPTSPTAHAAAVRAPSSLTQHPGGGGSTTGAPGSGSLLVSRLTPRSTDGSLSASASLGLIGGDGGSTATATVGGLANTLSPRQQRGARATFAETVSEPSSLPFQRLPPQPKYFPCLEVAVDREVPTVIVVSPQGKAKADKFRGDLVKPTRHSQVPKAYKDFDTQRRVAVASFVSSDGRIGEVPDSTYAADYATRGGPAIVSFSSGTPWGTSSAGPGGSRPTSRPTSAGKSRSVAGSASAGSTSLAQQSLSGARPPRPTSAGRQRTAADDSAATASKSDGSKGTPPTKDQKAKDQKAKTSALRRKLGLAGTGTGGPTGGACSLDDTERAESKTRLYAGVKKGAEKEEDVKRRRARNKPPPPTSNRLTAASDSFSTPAALTAEERAHQLSNVTAAAGAGAGTAADGTVGGDGEIDLSPKTKDGHAASGGGGKGKHHKGEHSMQEEFAIRPLTPRRLSPVRRREKAIVPTGPATEDEIAAKLRRADGGDTAAIDDVISAIAGAAHAQRLVRREAALAEKEKAEASKRRAALKAAEEMSTSAKLSSSNYIEATKGHYTSLFSHSTGGGAGGAAAGGSGGDGHKRVTRDDCERAHRDSGTAPLVRTVFSQAVEKESVRAKGQGFSAVMAEKAARRQNVQGRPGSASRQRPQRPLSAGLRRAPNTSSVDINPATASASVAGATEENKNTGGGETLGLPPSTVDAPPVPDDHFTTSAAPVPLGVKVKDQHSEMETAAQAGAAGRKGGDTNSDEQVLEVLVGSGRSGHGPPAIDGPSADVSAIPQLAHDGADASLAAHLPHLGADDGIAEDDGDSDDNDDDGHGGAPGENKQQSERPPPPGSSNLGSASAQAEVEADDRPPSTVSFLSKREEARGEKPVAKKRGGDKNAASLSAQFYSAAQERFLTHETQSQSQSHSSSRPQHQSKSSHQPRASAVRAPGQSGSKRPQRPQSAAAVRSSSTATEEAVL